MSSLAGSVVDAIGNYFNARTKGEFAKAKAILQKELELALWAEKLKFDSFRELYAERASLYKEVWKRIDLVSVNNWERDKLRGIPVRIKKEQVLFLRHYVVDLNREQGYVFDPVSRTFLLDLRWQCRACADVADDLKDDFIQWIYRSGKRSKAGDAHGIKLWLLKSGLRRSMVRAINSPEAGDPAYFDRKKEAEIVEDIKTTVADDSRRLVSKGDARLVGSIIADLFSRTRRSPRVEESD